MEIQQHDGVVVEVAAISAGLRQAQREGEVSREGEGGARGLGTQPSLPPLYIGALEGAGPLEIESQGGRRPRGGTCPPSQVGRPHP